MSSVGMSDKDIIKKLKKEGYSYEDIERAMLEAVKEGVGEGHTGPVSAPNMNRYAQAPVQREPETSAGYGDSSALEDMYGSDAPESVPESSTSIPELLNEATEELDVPGSDVIVEELVEGVVEEKWQRLTEKLDSFEDKFDNIDKITKHLESRADTEQRDFPTKEIDSKMSDISARLEDIEARVGGLEKAFRQFLPSLTRNIESLSSIIHEMKERAPV
jgi:DNA-binding transcriptional MerR regulator